MSERAVSRLNVVVVVVVVVVPVDAGTICVSSGSFRFFVSILGGPCVFEGVAFEGLNA